MQLVRAACPVPPASTRRTGATGRPWSVHFASRRRATQKPNFGAPLFRFFCGLSGFKCETVEAAPLPRGATRTWPGPPERACWSGRWSADKARGVLTSHRGARAETKVTTAQEGAGSEAASPRCARAEQRR
eukprot:3803723-Prymnesium_polylepis.1